MTTVVGLMGLEPLAPRPTVPPNGTNATSGFGAESPRRAAISTIVSYDPRHK
ncbi:MAG: hypothetical protein GY720_14535 [bacterium]|nr:hypothetical protein [bacterium]